MVKQGNKKSGGGGGSIKTKKGHSERVNKNRSWFAININIFDKSSLGCIVAFKVKIRKRDKKLLSTRRDKNEYNS